MPALEGRLSLAGATARGRFPAARITGTSKHPGRVVGADAAPEFMPERNSALIRNAGRTTDGGGSRDCDLRDGCRPLDPDLYSSPRGHRGQGSLGHA